jgi:hypothetical protein
VTTLISTDIDGDYTVRIDVVREDMFASIPHVSSEWWMSLSDAERFDIADRLMSDAPGTDVWLPCFDPGVKR